MINQFKKFYYNRDFIINALWALCFSKILISFLPFKHYAKRYGTPHTETSFEDLNASTSYILNIQTLLSKLAQRLPWKSKCLDQAMSAAYLLRKKNIPHTIYFGVQKKENKLQAHAWVRAGNQWIIGYHSNVSYTIVGMYAWVS